MYLIATLLFLAATLPVAGAGTACAGAGSTPQPGSADANAWVPVPVAPGDRVERQLFPRVSGDAATALLPTSPPGARLGMSVALSENAPAAGAVAVAGAPYDSIDGTSTGSVFVYRSTGDAGGAGGGWELVQRLNASPPQPESYLGFSVAVAEDGATVAAGADWADGGSGFKSGAVYVWQRGGNASEGFNYTQVAMLTLEGAAPDEYFGAAIALSGDVLLAGSNARNAEAGQAFVFTPVVGGSGAWSVAAELRPSPPALAGDRFGTSFAVDASSGLAAVGAPNAGEAGAVYLFAAALVEDSDGEAGGWGAWAQVAVLTDPERAPQDAFGGAVAVAGTVVLVGAHGDDASGRDTGSAFLFVADGPGVNGTYSLARRFAAPAGSEGDRFGGAVALAADGARAVVGAWRSSTLGADAGAVELWAACNGSDPRGPWALVQRHLPGAVDTSAASRFGYAVAASGGGAVLVGAPRHSALGERSGAAHVLLPAWGDASFEGGAAMLPLGADTDASAGAGVGAALAADGGLLVVGAPGAESALLYAATDNTGGVDASPGAGSDWARAGALAWPTGEGGAAARQFGAAVAVRGARVVVGAPAELSVAGAAVVFDATDPTRPSVVATLRPPAGAIAGAFGYAVSVDDHGVVAVGAPNTDGNQGRVYVFIPDGDSDGEVGAGYELVGDLLPEHADATDEYWGIEVLLEPAGELLFACGHRSDVGAQHAGAVEVWRKGDGEAAPLTRATTLVAHDALIGDFFGERLAVQWPFLLASAHGRNDAGFDTGTVYVFVAASAAVGAATADEAGMFVRVGRIDASDGGQESYFGSSVALSPAGAVVGARGDGGCAGAAYVFAPLDAADVLSPRAQVAKVAPTERVRDQRVGFAVAATGDVAFVGAPQAGSGAVFPIALRTRAVRAEAAPVGAGDAKVVGSALDRALIAAGVYTTHLWSRAVELPGGTHAAPSRQPRVEFVTLRAAPGSDAPRVVDVSPMLADKSGRLEGLSFGATGKGSGDADVDDLDSGGDASDDANRAEGGFLRLVGTEEVRHWSIERCAFVGGASGRGGAVFASGAALTVSVRASLFERCVAQSGGAMYASAGATVHVVDSSFVENAAVGTVGGAVAALDAAQVSIAAVDKHAVAGAPGGAVAPANELRDNHAALNGGAISAGVGAAITVEGQRLVGNFAGTAGGAADVMSAVLHLRRVVAEHNGAAERGGAIHVLNSHLEADECELRGNSAQVGGAVAVDRGVARMARTTCAHNAAALDGGAVWVQGASAALELAAFTAHGNSAGQTGGGVFARGAVVTVVAAAAGNGDAHDDADDGDNGVVLHSNRAASHGGGLSCVAGGFVSAQAGSLLLLRNNTAVVAGGGAFLGLCGAELNGTKVLNNAVSTPRPTSVRQGGGGLAVVSAVASAGDATVLDGSKVVLLRSAIVAGNAALTGGGVLCAVVVDGGRCGSASREAACLTDAAVLHFEGEGDDGDDGSGDVPRSLRLEGSLDVTDNAALRGRHITWLGTRPDGDGELLRTLEQHNDGAVASAPRRLVATDAPVNFASGDTWPPTAVQVQDAYGRASLAEAGAQVEVAVDAASGDAGAQVLAGAHAACASDGQPPPAVAGEAVLRELRVRAPPSSAIRVLFRLEPPLPGVAEASHAVAVRGCPVGSQPSAPGTCEPCPAGSAGGGGGRACDECAPGSASPTAGASTCARCFPGARSAAGAKRCEPCAAGSYATRDQTACLACPQEGALCTSGLIEIQAGYWSNGALFDGTDGGGASLRLYRCVEDGACIPGPNRSTVCAEGREGPLCARCAAGYHRSGGECVACGDGGDNAALLTLLLVTALGAFATAVWRNAQKRRKRLTRKSLTFPTIRTLLSHLQTLALMGATKVHWPLATAALFHGSGYASMLPVDAGFVVCAGDLSFYARFWVGVLAPVAAAVLMLAVPAAVAVRSRGEHQPPRPAAHHGEDAADVTTTGAAVGIELTAMPTRAPRAATATGAASLSPPPPTGKAAHAPPPPPPLQSPLPVAPPQGAPRAWTLWQDYASGLLVALYLLYPTVSQVVVSMLDCSPPIEGVSYITADYGEPCGSIKHQLHVVVAVAFLVAFCGGLPAYSAFAIWRHHAAGTLHSPRAAQWRFLMRGLRDSRTMWESLVTLRKFLLVASTAVLARYGAGLQLFAGCLVLGAALLANVAGAPYSIALQHRLELASLVISLFTLYCGFLDVLGAMQGAAAVAVALLVVLLNVSFAAVCAYVVCRSVRRSADRIKRKRRARNLASGRSDAAATGVQAMLRIAVEHAPGRARGRERRATDDVDRRNGSAGSAAEAAATGTGDSTGSGSSSDEGADQLDRAASVRNPLAVFSSPSVRRMSRAVRRSFTLDDDEPEPQRAAALPTIGEDSVARVAPSHRPLSGSSRGALARGAVRVGGEARLSMPTQRPPSARRKGRASRVRAMGPR